MRKVFRCLVFLLMTSPASSQDQITVIPADHHYIQYYGRFDKTNPALPKFWAPGAYIVTRFSGGDCEVFINDFVPEGGMHSYIEVKVDNIESVRIQLRAKVNRIQIAKDLPGGDHTVIITKNTEASVGYLELRGFRCAALLPPPPVPVRKIEFVGDDLTAGRGSDARYTPCDSAEWYDQHSAYNSYGSVAARNLNAQYHITAASGGGINKTKDGGTIPQVYDKIDMFKNQGSWDSKSYQPNVVTVLLGANDELADSTTFTNQYLSFLKMLRSRYPAARIVCMAPAGESQAGQRLRNYVVSIEAAAKRGGDQLVRSFLFSTTYSKGCNGLADIDEQRALGDELTAFLKQLMAW